MVLLPQTDCVSYYCEDTVRDSVLCLCHHLHRSWKLIYPRPGRRGKFATAACVPLVRRNPTKHLSPPPHTPPTSHPLFMTSHIGSSRRLWSFTVLARLLIALAAPCHSHWRRLMLFRTWCQNLVPVRHTRCFPSFLGFSCLVSWVLFLWVSGRGWEGWGWGVGVQNLAGCGHHGAAGEQKQQNKTLQCLLHLMNFLTCVTILLLRRHHSAVTF